LSAAIMIGSALSSFCNDRNRTCSAWQRSVATFIARSVTIARPVSAVEFS
jgi:hypothetical protein